MIPLNKPWLIKRDEELVVAALRRGELNGEGFYSQRLSERLRGLLGSFYVLPVSSGTHALELAVMALGLKPGDEVIMPSFNFTSAATAVMRAGAVPVFADLEERFLGLDPDRAAEKISVKTKALLVVHYGGWAAEVERLKDLAFNMGLFLIEDAAHCLGAYYDGRHLGTFGECGCFSFHSTKNITCGEGGVFTCQEDYTYRQAQMIRDKGTNRQAFLQGEVDKYTWVSPGSSFLLADVLSALALAQLERVSTINELRAGIAQRYYSAFKKWEDLIILPTLDEKRKTNWHVFYFRLKDASRRDKVLEELKNQGVGAAFHFIPLHLSPMGKSLGYQKGNLPLTEGMADSLVRLPIYPQMTEEEANQVIRAVNNTLSRF